jgi:hypothetical protein
MSAKPIENSVIVAENFMSALVRQTHQFVDSLTKFHKIVAGEDLGDKSVAAYISSSPQRDRVWVAMAEELHLTDRLFPIYSTDSPETGREYGVRKYHMFAVWLLGTIKGLKIRNKCELFSDGRAEDGEDSGGSTYEMNATDMPGGRMQLCEMSMKTVLVLLMRRFEMDDKLKRAIDTVATRIDEGQEALDAYHRCENGKCDTCGSNSDGDDEECGTYREWEDNNRDIAKETRGLFSQLCRSSFYIENAEFGSQGLEPYMMHPQCYVDDNRMVFAVVRKPEAEKAEKERVAAQQREKQEKQEASQKAAAKRQLAAAESQMNEAKRKLDELQGKPPAAQVSGVAAKKKKKVVRKNK